MSNPEEIDKILFKYPNRVAVILVQTPNFKKYYSLKKEKYIINGDNTIGLFLFHLKRLNDIKTLQSFFLFHHNTLLNSSQTFNALKNQFIYEKALVLTIDCENAFG